MTAWEFRRAGDLQEQGILLVEDGNHGEYRPRPTEFSQTGVAFIRAADMREGVVNFSNAAKINETAMARIRKGIGHPGDVLLTHKGTVGTVARAPQQCPDFVCSPQTTFWRTTRPSVLDQGFLHATLRSSFFQAQLDRLAHQTDMAPYASLTDQKTLHIPLPPLPEQQAIAEVLGALDDKIAANRALVATLDELIRAHYLWTLTEQRESRPMMDALNVTFGEAFKGEFFSPRGTGRPLLRIRDIAKGSSETWTTEERPGETIIEPGTVVAGMDADFTASFWLGNPSLLNQRVCSITSSEFGPAFAREIAQPALTAIANQKSGTTVIHLNKADMLRTTVDLPAGPSGPARSRAADGLLSALVNAAEESTTLASLRDTLLPALMDGTIRVKDAEGALSEAP